MAEVQCFTIQEAWYKACTACMESGHVFPVRVGSYVGQRRKQLASFSVYISHPETRPFGFEFNGVAIASDAAIEKYFYDYIVSTELAVNEQYTYGSRIMPQIEATAEKLIASRGCTNQAIITIGKFSDVELPDPPCLREIAWKWHPGGTLRLTAYIRSWDLCCALPSNLGGLQLLNEMMAELVSMPAGPLVVFSDGAHIYEHNWGMFNCK